MQTPQQTEGATPYDSCPVTAWGPTQLSGRTPSRLPRGRARGTEPLRVSSARFPFRRPRLHDDLSVHAKPPAADAPALGHRDRGRPCPARRPEPRRGVCTHLRPPHFLSACVRDGASSPRLQKCSPGGGGRGDERVSEEPPRVGGVRRARAGAGSWVEVVRVLAVQPLPILHEALV